MRAIILAAGSGGTHLADGVGRAVSHAGPSFAGGRRQSSWSRTYYLDLGRLAGPRNQRNTPFTPAIHAYYALVEALRELEEQGDREGRYGHYAGLAYARPAR